jgi:hypothetical protein
VAVRTPYDRTDSRLVEAFLQLARHGDVVISQDRRGTGGSEPDSWDYCGRPVSVALFHDDAHPSALYLPLGPCDNAAPSERWQSG